MSLKPVGIVEVLEYCYHHSYYEDGMMGNYLMFVEMDKILQGKSWMLVFDSVFGLKDVVVVVVGAVVVRFDWIVVKIQLLTLGSQSSDKKYAGQLAHE